MRHVLVQKAVDQVKVPTIFLEAVEQIAMPTILAQLQLAGAVGFPKLLLQVLRIAAENLVGTGKE